MVLFVEKLGNRRKGELTFTAQQHVTINAAQLTLVKYDVASKSWKPAS